MVRVESSDIWIHDPSSAIVVEKSEMTNDPPRGEAAASPAKRLKVAHQFPQPRNSTIFAPFRVR